MEPMPSPTQEIQRDHEETMTMNITHKILSVLGLAVAAVSALPSHAQNYPNGTVKMIVPFSPGGGVDSVARVLAQYLPSKINGTFIVENKPGAAGNIAHAFVAKAPADGLTLLVTSNAIVINQAIDQKLQFHAINSFAPVALISSSPVALVGRTSLPIKTLPELLAYAKANPGQLSYGSCGNGGVHHLAAELLKKSAGVDILHVPYKGCSVAVTDVLGGQIDLASVSANNVISHIRANRVIPFAVTTAKRSPLMPTVPTVQEAGIRDYDLDGWYGLLAPAGTPKEIVTKLNTAVNQLLQTPEFKEAMTKNFMDSLGGSPEKFETVMKADLARFTAIATSANIRPD
jgi:tripartite-type tricarboxylate transporter receptor subunit TctC